MFQPPPSVLSSCFDPPFLPPSSLGGRFSVSQHIRGGVFDPSLLNSPALLSLTLGLFPFSCFSSLSIHHLHTATVSITYRQSPSSKMTFRDFTKGPSVQLSEVSAVRKRKMKNKKGGVRQVLVSYTDARVTARARRSLCLI